MWAYISFDMIVYVASDSQKVDIRVAGIAVFSRCSIILHEGSGSLG